MEGSLEKERRGVTEGNQGISQISLVSVPGSCRIV